MSGVLEGKVAIVTGAADGMGLAITERFAREGARVIATDINGDKLSAAHAQNGSVTTIAIDITNKDAPEKLVSSAVEAGGLDILINAAGIFMLSDLEEMNDDHWNKTMEVNLNAPMRLCRRAIPELKKSGEGRIVNIGSTNSLRARNKMGAYTVSKHAVTGLTISLAVELGKYGITVNAINPGTILTGITRDLMKNPTWHKDLATQGVMNRLGTVEEIAQAALYLVGPNSGFTTGHSLAVDAGFLVKYPDLLL